MRTYKLGEEIITNEDKKIIVHGKVETMEKGTKLLVARRGINILTGKFAGGILPPANEELKGTDFENITKYILDRMDLIYGLYEILEDNEIDIEDFKQEFESKLWQIL